MAELSIIKSVETVAPDQPTWKGILPMSEFDQAAGFAYVPYIYFYNNPTHKSKNDVVSALKDSLSRCLSHFYPIAGRIHRAAAGGRMELHCNAAGAVVVEAEMPTAKMDEVMESDGRRPAMSDKYKQLSYDVEYSLKPTHEQALLYAQVTWFSCGGFSLGISISHALTDGLGGHHLISEWTRLARGESIERTPYLKRDVLGANWNAAERLEEEDQRRASTPMLQVAAPVLMKELGLVNLSLTKNQMEALKAAAHADGEMTNLHRPYTRFEVLTAHIWRCMCKARGETGGAEPTVIAFSVDSRTRLSPPLPPNFFGNSVLPVAAKALAKDLISNPLGFGCSRVRRSIENVTSNYIWSDIENLRLIKDFRTMPGIRVPGESGSSTTVKPEMLVVSWLRLPLYGRDFGWGKETHMGAGPQTTEGNTIIFPGRGEDGSVVVAMCLDKAHAQQFNHHFFNF